MPICQSYEAERKKFDMLLEMEILKPTIQSVLCINEIISSILNKESSSETKKQHTRRHRILLTARNLMLEKGYSATTVDDICKTAEVAKGGFFHHFSSKEVMAREVLERFIEGLFISMSVARDPRIEQDPLKRLRRMFSQLASTYEGIESGPGCLLGMLTMELSAHDEQFGKTCAKAFNTLRDGIQDELEAALKKYEITNQNARQLADGAVAAIQGAAVLGRATNDMNRIRSTIENYANLLEQIILGKPGNR